jgi:hypothetical protein
LLEIESIWARVLGVLPRVVDWKWVVPRQTRFAYRLHLVILIIVAEPRVLVPRVGDGDCHYFVVEEFVDARVGG